MYKLYINPLLVQLEETNLGSRIGNVLCNATARADDVTLMASSDEEMQVLINMASRFANMEGYKLQPKKSVLLHVKTRKNDLVPDIHMQLGDENLSSVTKASHLGILRTKSLKENVKLNVEENIKKARRCVYSIFGEGSMAVMALILKLLFI